MASEGLLGVGLAAGVIDRGARGGGDRDGKQRHHHRQHQNQCLDPIGGARPRIATDQLQHDGPPGQAKCEAVHRGVAAAPVRSAAVVVKTVAVH
ncbi:hypothetical protein BOH72_05790 [Mycobacterium sp. WY10]|nr:hypothetical protein BOH72_05790 [Mycobacterium sp. WY10]